MALGAFAQELDFDKTPVYFHRAFANPEQRKELAALVNRGPVRSILISTAAYEKIDPEEGLLIHDCGHWCDAESFAFPMVLVAGGASNSAYKGWVASVQRLIPGLQPKFQLLAVVNRMDLAHWSGGMWNGAELRFVYGLAPTPSAAPNFTVIYECVLKPMCWKQFQQMGSDWTNLSGHAIDELGPALVTTIFPKYFAQKVEARRLRINTDMETGATWRVHQWDYKDGAFQAALLTDQMGAPLVLEDDMNKQRRQLYLDQWAALDQSASITSQPIPGELLEQMRQYIIGSAATAMPIPAERCASQDADNRRDRNILSLQQCHGCHSVETNTRGAHIMNRPMGKTCAKLSEFLSPHGSSAKLPLQIDGLDQDENAQLDGLLLKVTVNYQKLACPPSTGKIVRKYHDLDRRTRFLTAILGSPSNPSAEEADGLARQAELWGPDFVH